jgi:hypothetical protein
VQIATEGKETNWWFRKWCDPVGEHTETSGVDPKKRPYPIDGTWERYTLKVGNIRFLMNQRAVPPSNVKTHTNVAARLGMQGSTKPLGFLPTTRNR